VAPPPPFRPRDLLREVQIQEIEVAPDGESVVYARRTIESGEYRKRLWRVPWRGGRPEQLTRGELDAGPRFSPDGSTLLFLSQRSGKLRPWLLPLAGGEPTELASPEGGVALADWSPDGKRILLLAPSGEPRFAVGDPEKPLARRIEDLTWRLDGVGIRDEFTSLWVVPVRAGKPMRLTDPGYEVFDAAWSPDGERIAFVADTRPEAKLREDAQAWQVPAAGGRPRKLAALPGEIAAAAWSSAGTLGLIGISEPAEGLAAWAHYDLYVVEGTRRRQLGADLDRSLAFLTSGDFYTAAARTPRVLWLDDEQLVAPVCDRGRGHLYRFGLDGSAEQLITGDVACSFPATGSGRVATIATEGGRPGEVCAVENGRLRPLTRDGSRWLGRARRDPEAFPVSHPDGHEIEAWVVRGRGSRRRRPLVLHVHGGPHLAHGPAPWLEMLALADAGISVVYANPRGSVGYGLDFARAIAGSWGDTDADDLMQVVDHAVGEGLGDEGRLGILGLSYGGYMVNWLMGRHPGRFAAGVSENPVTDLASFLGTSDYGAWIAEIAAGTSALADGRERLADRSPATWIERNEAPLLLLQAERDMRCPADQTELVFAALRKLGRPVEMVRYPEESHLLGFSGRPDRRVDRLERIVAWFGRHL
jgi:dipeptidyl aminopeptidase/acylaminoacyl peptidase